MLTSQMYDSSESGAIALNPLITSANGVPVISSLVLAEGLGLNHRSLITTIRRHLTSIEEFGRVLLRKAPLKTRGGNQLVTQVDLNENQALFIGSLSENTAQVIAFKVTLIKEFDKARRALAEYAHTVVLQRQEALVGLCNGLMERFASLEFQFDQVRKLYGQTYQATVTHADKEAMTDYILRERIMTRLAAWVRFVPLDNWPIIWDAFGRDYNIDVNTLERHENEHLVDAVIRHGYLDELLEFAFSR